jgi:hypothetical protein
MVTTVVIIIIIIIIIIVMVRHEIKELSLGSISYQCIYGFIPV